MRGFSSRISLVILSIALVVQISACGSGGEDKPFIFGGETGESPPPPPLPPPPPPPPPPECAENADCPEDMVCNPTTKKCEEPPPTGCSDDVPCPSGQVCDATTHLCRAATCTDNPGICTATQKCESGTCVCDPAKTECEPPPPPGACEVDFSAALLLRADSPISDQFDIPAACFYYNVEPEDAFNPDPTVLFRFNGDPNCDLADDTTCHSDLYCCAAGNVPATTPDGDPLTCDDPALAIDDDAQGRILALANWLPDNNQPMKILFQVTDTGCRFSIRANSFPRYGLQNSGLDAALLIDAGGTSPADPQLEGLVAEGTCDESPEGITLQTDPGSGLRFRVRFFTNSIKVPSVQPFTAVFPPGIPQILPPLLLNGTAQTPLSFTTGSFTANFSGEPSVRTPPTQVESLSITGQPIHLEGEKSFLSLVTGLTIPAPTDTYEGGRLLESQIGGAALVAELKGEVKRASDGQPIRTLEDLANCGVVGCDNPPCCENPPCETLQTLSLSMTADYTPDDSSDPPQTLAVTGDTTQGFTAETSFPTDNSPYAKAQSDLDATLSPTVAARFSRPAVIRVVVESSTNIDLPLNIPSTAGPFRILNADSFQGIVLAKNNQHTIELHLSFEPTLLEGSGCTGPEESNVLACEGEISISNSPSVRIRLNGQARRPAPDMKIEEINPVSVDGTNATIAPVSLTPPIPEVSFGEATVAIETRTKLFRIRNEGVRDLKINNIQAQDAPRNFRLGSVYRGPSFQGRSWVVGRRELWTVPPTGEGSLFFFLNYGPFGQVSDLSSIATCGAPATQPTRCDAASLVLSTAEFGTFLVPLSGRATNDTRAVLEMYIEDDKRFQVDHDDDNPPGFASSEHLYLVERPLDSDGLFSLRQDPESRSVYLRNANGSAPQLDSLVLTTLPTRGGADPGQFGFASEVSPSAESPLTIEPNQIVKIGELTIPEGTSDGLQRFFAELQVSAVSKPPAEGASSRLPVVGGYFTEQGLIDKSRDAGTVAFRLGRATGAPHGPRDLRINRLFAGFDKALVTGAPLVVSSTTRGIIGRYNATSPDISVEEYEEIFTVPGALDFDAEGGTLTLNPVFTPVTLEGRSSDIPGIRLFSGPGSNPINDYLFECRTSGGDCGFFFGYIGDWTSTNQNSVTCGGRPPISPDPGLQNAIDPQNCTRETSALVPSVGVYDPVTGEISFDDLALRLYSPDTPATDTDIDASLRIGLTTRCLTDAFVPDSAAREKRLVPPLTLAVPLDFASPSELPNPLTRYVDGERCAERELHGRPLGEPDGTDTLDNLGGFAVGPFTFDLAAVGKIKAGTVGPTPEIQGQANGIMMYVIIKAEVED